MIAADWPVLMARYPALGDLLAEVRAFRGPDADAYFWWPGGVHDRVLAILQEPDDPLDTSAAIEILWDALPVSRSSAPVTFTSARQIAASPELWSLASSERTPERDACLDALHDEAWRLRLLGGPDAALADALARLCANLVTGCDTGIAAAWENLGRVMPPNAQKRPSG